MFGADFDDVTRPLVMKIVRVEPCCPQCKADLSAKVQLKLMSGGRVQCVQCGFYGNWKFGTVLHNSRLSNIQFLVLFFKYTVPNDAPAIAKHLGIDPGTVREWRTRIMSAVAGEQQV
jgi:transposase-like protein